VPIDTLAFAAISFIRICFFDSIVVCFLDYYTDLLFSVDTKLKIFFIFRVRTRKIYTKIVEVSYFYPNYEKEGVIRRAFLFEKWLAENLLSSV